MAAEEQPDKKTQYQSFEEFRKRFYATTERADPRQQEDGEVASFGKRLAKELVRRDR
jgi:hypothetical protein